MFKFKLSKMHFKKLKRLEWRYTDMLGCQNAVYTDKHVDYTHICTDLHTDIMKLHKDVILASGVQS